MTWAWSLLDQFSPESLQIPYRSVSPQIRDPAKVLFSTYTLRMLEISMPIPFKKKTDSLESFLNFSSLLRVLAAKLLPSLSGDQCWPRLGNHQGSTHPFTNQGNFRLCGRNEQWNISLTALLKPLLKDKPWVSHRHSFK